MHSVKTIAANAAIIFMVGLITACGGGGGGTSSEGSAPGGAAGGVTGPVVPGLPAKSLEIYWSSVPEGAQAVDPRTAFELAFTVAVSGSGLSSDQVQLSDGSNTFPVKIVIAGTALKVTPVTNLHTGTDYRLTVKAGATGSDGSVLKSDYVLKFRTLLAVYETRELAPSERLTAGGGANRRIMIADVNGDGRPDLVEMAELHQPGLFIANGYTLNVLLQNSAGGFDKFQKLEYVADQSGYSKSFNNLIVLDIDGDNTPELLVPEYRAGDEPTAGIRVFKVGTDGKFAAQEFIATNYTETLQALDVDGDGKIDLVGGNRQAIDQVTGGFQVLLHTAAGFTKLAPVRLPYGGYEFGVADLDQDGKRELIVNRFFAKPNNGPATTELLVYSQGAAGVFSPNAGLTDAAIGICTNVTYCRDMKIADLNGDGKPELIFTAQTIGYPSDTVAIGFSLQPGGRLSKIFQIVTAAAVFGIQDMDGDGIPDLFVYQSASGSFSIIGGRPNFSWVFSNMIKAPAVDMMYPETVAIGDIDGDGRPDIVFDSYNSGIAMKRHVKY